MRESLPKSLSRNKSAAYGDPNTQSYVRFRERRSVTPMEKEFLRSDPTEDARWMQVALALAEKGRGFVEPNPMVGCVLVRDGVQIGSGFHEKYGCPHAEVNALAGLSAADVRSATLYVTLEPCNHFGKTPPCVDAILRNPPHRIVVAMEDPFPEVAGKGISRLRESGIPVDLGILETESRWLNAPYLKLIREKKPWVIAKWAMTLDGALATEKGDSQWISNEASRALVHRMRSGCDAILIGSETALLDDPLLTTRLPSPEVPPRRAHRVVLDRRLRIAADSRLVTTAREWPLIVITNPPDTADRASENTRATQLRRLLDLGVCVWTIPAEVSEAPLPWILEEMGRLRWTNILVEGGGRLLGSFWDARLVDQFDCFISPRVLGSGSSRRPISGKGHDWMNQACRADRIQWESLDGDLHCRGFIGPWI